LGSPVGISVISEDWALTVTVSAKEEITSGKVRETLDPV
jgi:hypothetical protein